jgi:hypothetical protein
VEKDITYAGYMDLFAENIRIVDKNKHGKTNKQNKMDASVKSTLPPRFWSVGSAFAAFFGLLAVASK